MYWKNWLKLHDVTYHNYVSVIDGPMKADLDYDVFIDDSPLNAIKFLKHKKMSFYIHNHGINLFLIKTFKEFLLYLKAFQN